MILKKEVIVMVWTEEPSTKSDNVTSEVDLAWGSRLPKVPPKKKPIVPICEGDQASLAIHWMPCLYTFVGHSGQHQRYDP